jgi:hypothetical protein
MGNRQVAEKLLEAAKRVAEAEFWLEQAREEYWNLFQQATGHTNKKGKSAPAATVATPSIVASNKEATVVETSPASPEASNGHTDSSTVVQRVHQFLLKSHKSQDAQATSTALDMPINSVRWALVVLAKQGVAKRISRGKYEAAVKGKDEEAEQAEQAKQATA